MIRAQGGDPSAVLPVAAHTSVVAAPASGYVTALDARGVGVAAWRLGAGRARKEDAVSLGAGILCLKKPGEPVEEGEPVLELRADDESRFEGARAALEGAVQVGPEPVERGPLVIERIG
jgi:thymidine phosphorylase